MRILCSLLRWIGYLPVVRLLLLVEAGLLLVLMTGILSVSDWLNYVGYSMYFGTLVGGPVLAASLLSPERRPLVLSRPLSRPALMGNLLLAAGLGWVLLAVLLFGLVALWRLFTDAPLSLVVVGLDLGFQVFEALVLLPWTLLFWLIFQDTISAVAGIFMLNYLTSASVLRHLPAPAEMIFRYLRPPLDALSDLARNWPASVPEEPGVRLLATTLLVFLLIIWNLRHLES